MHQNSISKHPKYRSKTVRGPYYVYKIFACFDHLPPCVDIFYGMKVYKKWTFLDHLSTSSCKRMNYVSKLEIKQCVLKLRKYLSWQIFKGNATCQRNLKGMLYLHFYVMTRPAGTSENVRTSPYNILVEYLPNHGWQLSRNKMGATKQWE